LKPLHPDPGDGTPSPPAPDPGTCTLLLELVDHLDAMVAYWDAEETCRFANQAYFEWFGRSRETLLGVKLKELLGPLYELNLPFIRAAYNGERQVFERAIPTPDGRTRHSLATYVPRRVGGEVVGIFVHVADVEPLKRLQADLEAAKARAENLAVHDFLTGLPNRVLLDTRIEEALAESKRTGQAVHLLSIDVDDFKTINDTHGHAAGDRILVEIAARIAACARSEDTVARLGGDEFNVLAIGLASDAEAQALAQRILAAVHQPVRLRGAVLLPAVSIGISAFPGDGTTAESFLEASDAALYDAKRSGRNVFALARRAEGTETRPGDSP
jgi:diguanylate cyclase (GGDEF)-like protein/PAS domain S-box-containing protein